MRMPVVTLTLAVALLAYAMPAWAQHEGSQAAAASPELLAACVQSQRQAMALVDAGDRRVELARQTNDPAAMRAAVDDFQMTLSAVRTQLAPCAQLATAPPSGDPHAGHVMPTTAPAQAAGTSGASSSTISQTATPSQDHAAHGQAMQAQATQAGSTSSLDITFRGTPSPLRGAAENDFEVTVKDRQGKPVDGAEVSLLFYMPAMPSTKMPEMRSEAKLKAAGNGIYAGTGQVMMAGQWTVTVSVKQNGTETGQTKVTVSAK